MERHVVSIPGLSAMRLLAIAMDEWQGHGEETPEPQNFER